MQDIKQPFDLIQNFIKEAQTQYQIAFERLIPNHKDLNAQDFRKVVFEQSELPPNTSKIEHFYHKKIYVGSIKAQITQADPKHFNCNIEVSFSNLKDVIDFFKTS